jgi:Luciferase-like monooxygenase
MELFSFFPTSGEGRYLATSIGARPVTLGYLRQIAGAIDELGYTGALLPTGQGCEDAWVTASALMPFTRRLKFLVAVRPGLSSGYPHLEEAHRVAELLFPVLGLNAWGHSVDKPDEVTAERRWLASGVGVTAAARPS